MEHAALDATLALFSIIGLVLTLTIATLRQLPDLFRAYRDARQALRGARTCESDWEGDSLD